MKDVLDELRDLNLLVPDNGAEIVNLKDQNLGAAVIAKSDGSMLYLSRDIAAALDRKEFYKFDQMVYVVGNQQDHHFKQLTAILSLMGKPWSEDIQHVNFGMIKSKTGQMSTRKGKVVFLEEILDHTKEEMHTVMKSNTDKYAHIENPEYVSDLVGISSIVIQDMSARRHKDYEFDWNRMLSFEGDTGPYLQYAHARLCSIERLYCEAYGLSTYEPIPTTLNFELLNEPQAHALLDILSFYPSLVHDVAKSYEPNSIVTFMFELCHRVSSAYEVLYVRGQEKDIADVRMALYYCAKITLGNALRLVGLRPLERM
jgi:arginyl-tRNA synthetase